MLCFNLKVLCIFFDALQTVNNSEAQQTSRNDSLGTLSLADHTCSCDGWKYKNKTWVRKTVIVAM